MYGALVQSIIAQDRQALSRAITLVESTLDDHRKQAEELLEAVLPHTGKSLRIGITGVPGVGKSTFIESFGLLAIEKGRRVAVLPVDPSSTISGGSILGDKTRMQALANHKEAFVRPSPTGGLLGGVARRTGEAILLCEAAGYDLIIVETVGVGQSETKVADMVDMFWLLLLPGSGDELQGIKRGIVEMVDLLIINKADGDLLAQAKRVQSDYTSALPMLASAGQGWKPRAMLASALEKTGMVEIWNTLQEFADLTKKNDTFEARRLSQRERWFASELREALVEKALASPHIRDLVEQSLQLIRTQTKTPAAAVRTISEKLFS